MEHKTIKKILIGLFFCVVLFVLSFILEEKSNLSNDGGDASASDVKIVKSEGSL